MIIFLKGEYDATERLTAQMKRAIAAAVQSIKDATVVADVERAIAAGDIEGAIDAIAFDIGEQALEAVIPLQLRTAYETAAHGARKELGDQLDKPAIEIGFNITNPDAIQAVQDHAADLIKDFGDSSKDMLRSLISDSMSLTGDEAISPRELARQIIGSGIGITDQSRNALENYRTGLEEDTALTDSQIDTQVEAMASRYLRQRGETIARTEIMRASRAGSQGLWVQAKAQGLLGENAVQVWHNGNDPCDDCEELDGETASLGEDFPGDGGDGPPLHPRCTCHVTLEPFGVKDEGGAGSNADEGDGEEE